MGVKPSMDEESRDWLEADLAGDWPDYDWGEAGIPEGLPVRYVVGEGVVIGDEASNKDLRSRVTCIVIFQVQSLLKFG
jgi:hypothetical protein